MYMAYLLVVDPDEARRRGLVERLEQAGRKVDAVADGPGVRAAVAAKPPDLVVADADGPRALAALAEVRQGRGVALPVVVLGADYRRVREALGNPVCCDYLPRGCEPEELLFKVDTLLRGGAGMRELMASREALAEEEARLRSLGDNLPSGAIYQMVRDADGRDRFTYVSRGITSVLGGVTPEAMIADPWAAFGLVLEEERPRCFEAHQRSAETGCVIDLELPQVLPDGRPTWLHITSTPRRREDGSVVWDGFVRDITARKRAEAELRREKWRLECMDRISGALTRSPDLASMVHALVEQVLEVFGVDRAWLLYPCDPDATRFHIPVEATRADFPGAREQGRSLANDVGGRRLMVEALEGRAPVLRVFDDPAMRDPEEVRYGVRSMLVVALFPRGDQPWLLGIHQCTHVRRFTPDEQYLLARVAERATDVLTGLLLNRRLQEDIAERTRVEALLKESHDRLALAEAIGHFGYWDWDMASDRGLWSAEACRMHGVDPDSFEPGFESFLACVHPDDRTRFLWAREAAMQGTERLDMEYRIVRPDGGGERHARTVAEVRWQGQGKAPRLVGVVHDITDLKVSREELRLERERLALAMEAAGEGMWELDLASRWLHFDPDSVRQLGYARGELDGELSGWLQRVAAEDRAVVAAAVEDCAQGRAERLAVELRLRTRDGGWRWFGANGKVVGRDAEGRARMLIGIHRDVTERKRAEREMVLLNERLEQRVAERTAELQAANRELEAFAYSVSHDLRAPLRAVSGFSEAIEKDYGDRLYGEGAHLLQRLQGAAARMGDLIDGLLRLSRCTRGQLNREPVDLSALAREVAAGLAEQAPERAVQVHIAEGLTARGDPRLLRIVLENLLGNAWKYTAGTPDARIEMAVDPGPGAPVFRVRDNGAGFDMDYADRLFQPFQRLHRQEDFQGLGIGLATVQRIVQRHGGRIWAEGTAGQGATLYFTLQPSLVQPPAPA
jgi:PAS domain S-box-containing protein